MSDNVDIASNREEFRAWLAENHATEHECWLRVRRGRPSPDAFAYLDAVEEALCFGWIGSTPIPLTPPTLSRLCAAFFLWPVCLLELGGAEAAKRRADSWILRSSYTASMHSSMFSVVRSCIS